MSRIAFKMKLHPGKEVEYKKRHEEIWPELKELLKSKGISHYSIFLDESSGELFATLDIQNPGKLDELPANAIMKKWWHHMNDIMETHADNSPVSIPLKEVFFLP